MFIAVNHGAVKVWILRTLTLILLCVLFLGAVSFRYPLKYIDIIEKYAAAGNIEPSLVCAVIHAESKFMEEALSHKGASGLMQLTEGTADWMADQMGIPNYAYNRIFEPSLNIYIGCGYLGWLLDRYKNVDLAVAAYNAGCGNVDNWLKEPRYSPDGKNLNIIPFKETRDYVNRVRINKRIYDIIIKIYGDNK